MCVCVCVCVCVFVCVSVHILYLQVKLNEALTSEELCENLEEYSIYHSFHFAIECRVEPVYLAEKNRLHYHRS